MPDNPAQPLLDLRDKISHYASKLTGKSQEPAKKAAPVDTSWHDQMVKQANESIRKQAEAKSQKKISKDDTKPAQKSSAAKTSSARKRISSK